MSFNNVPSTKCADVARRVAAHASEQWTVGEQLASRGNYASSIAWKILALEEYSKALLLHIDSKGFKLRQLSSIVALNKSHKQRHLLLLLIAILASFGQLMNELIHWLATNDSDANEDVEDEDIRLKQALPGLVVRLRKEILPAMKRLTDSHDQLDRLKQLAMYTDYKDALITPLDIGEAEYEANNLVLISSQKAIVDLCGWLDRDEPHVIAALQSLRRKLKNPEDYRKLNEYIKVNFNGSRPFDPVRSIFHTVELFLAVSASNSVRLGSKDAPREFNQ